MIDKYAKEGNPLAFIFPKTEMPDLDFSFSGIKTSILYFLQNNLQKNPNFIQENLHDICASVQHTLVETLMQKLRKASKQTHIKEIAIAGGVAANSGLRNTLMQEAEKSGWNVYIPEFQYCTDNAAMIAMVAHYKFLAKDFCPQQIGALARWAI
jgi:N6-L-threonylcarbamoyladenine synthase